MKRIVNGEEVDLQPASGVEVSQLQDRLIVRGPDGAYSALALRIGDATHISYRGNVYLVEKAGASRRAHQHEGSGEIRATMPGQIVDVFVSVGDTVQAGDKLVVLEAMKTQQAFVAPFDGEIKEVNLEKGRQVSEGQILVVLSRADPLESGA